MRRREFLKTTAALAATAMIRSRHAEAQAQPAAPKFILSAPLTQPDWMLKPGIEWGPAGVKHMLDACKACGWSRIHWRVLDGGRALYASKLVRPEFKMETDNIWDPQTDEEKKRYKSFFANISEQRRLQILHDQQRFDYGTFDTLAEAVRYGHSIGLKIDAWASINEDDHGWGLISDFARAHPQYRWIKRDGTPYHSQMSFSFPEVREYKLNIIRELLQYDIDGLFIDWIRTGDIRDNPQNDPKGVADYGYEQPNVDELRKQFNVSPQEIPANDPRWVKIRCEPQTQFMRDLRKLTRLPIAVLVGHPWHYRGMVDKIDGNPRGLLLDTATWANEGLMDAAVAAGYYRDGGDARKAAEALKNETSGKVDVWTYGWVPQTAAEFNGDCDIAASVGAKHILFWEADYIDDRPNAAELKAAMTARAVTG
jgi:hypothetical protein